MPKARPVRVAGSVFGPRPVSYTHLDLMEQAKNLQELSNSSNRQLIWIASISLLVGGIGVMRCV